jgi:hypothetical protein
MSSSCVRCSAQAAGTRSQRVQATRLHVYIGLTNPRITMDAIGATKIVELAIFYARCAATAVDLAGNIRKSKCRASQYSNISARIPLALNSYGATKVQY